MNRQEEWARKVDAFEGSKDPFITTSIHNIASSLVEKSAKVKPGEKVLIVYDQPGIQLAQELRDRCFAKGAGVSFFEQDLEEDARDVLTATDDQLDHFFDDQGELVNQADVILLVYGPKNPEAMKDVPIEKMERYRKSRTRARKKVIDGSVRFTSFRWPIKYEADIEGMTSDEYFRTVIEACSQPWDEIFQAQKKLVEKLNKGKILQFKANIDDPDPKKRTDITMSIEGMTFANSTIELNYPGSEVFSAPVLNSVNGQIYAPGQYLYNSHLMKNIYLKVKKGKIIEAHADEGDEYLQEILNEANKPGNRKKLASRRFGEVAFGTNPALTKRFLNPLFAEKASGTSHMAVGHCYEYNEINEIPVNVNNGNTKDLTTVHWDITISMLPEAGGGEVLLDGEVIQRNGRFLDEELAILNPKT